MTWKKFFTPTKWKTVWSENLNLSKKTLFTTYVTRGTIVLQVAENKDNKFRCYITTGDMENDVDPLFLFNEYPQVKEILKNNGIKIDEI